MTKGDILMLNETLNAIKIPSLSSDDFYKILSCKADISIESDKINEKISKLRNDIRDKFAKEKKEGWVKEFTNVLNKYLSENYDGKMPAKCISRDIFSELCVGVTISNAEMLMKYLVE